MLLWNPWLLSQGIDKLKSVKRIVKTDKIWEQAIGEGFSNLQLHWFTLKLQPATWMKSQLWHFTVWGDVWAKVLHQGQNYTGKGQNSSFATYALFTLHDFSSIIQLLISFWSPTPDRGEAVVRLANLSVITLKMAVWRSVTARLWNADLKWMSRMLEL